MANFSKGDRVVVTKAIYLPSAGAVEASREGTVAEDCDSWNVPVVLDGNNGQVSGVDANVLRPA